MTPDPSLARPIWRCDAAPGSQRVINHNCFNSINDVFRNRSELVRQVSDVVGVFFIVMAGPARGRSRRATAFRAVLPCLALIALTGADARAQTVTPDLFSPTRSSQLISVESPLRRTAAEANDPLQQSEGARERQGPTRAVACRADPALRPAHRQRRIDLGLRLAQSQAPEAEVLSGPGQAETAGGSRQPAAADVEYAAAVVNSAVAKRQQDPDPACDGRHRGGPARAQAAQGRRRSVRRGRRLRRQFSDQISGRTRAVATTPIPAAL